MQFLFLHPIRVRVVFLLTSMILFTISCEDDDHDHDEEHIDADGFVLEDESGTEVYREFEGAMTGTVTLTVGDTLELTVHFLDHEANEIEHEEEEHEDELKVSENDANIAVVEVESHEDGEEDEEHHEMFLAYDWTRDEPISYEEAKNLPENDPKHLDIIYGSVDD